jgi:hypothetical protein
MGCWKWFNGILKEANVTITDDNKAKIDDVIHKYIGEQSSYGRCSADWKKARVEIKESPKIKAELVAKPKPSRKLKLINQIFLLHHTKKGTQTCHTNHFKTLYPLTHAFN